MPKAKSTVRRSGPYERPVASSSGEASGRIKEEDVAEQVPLASHDQIPEAPAGTDVGVAGAGVTLVSDCWPLMVTLNKLQTRIMGRGHKVEECLKAMDVAHSEHIIGDVALAIEKLAEGMEKLRTKLLKSRDSRSPHKAIKTDQHEFSKVLESTVLKAEGWLNKFEDQVLTRPTYRADPRKADFRNDLRPLQDEGKLLNVECGKLATQCLLLGILL